MLVSGWVSCGWVCLTLDGFVKFDYLLPNFAFDVGVVDGWLLITC